MRAGEPRNGQFPRQFSWPLHLVPVLTTDVEAAKAFYSAVIGWSTRDASESSCHEPLARRALSAGGFWRRVVQNNNQAREARRWKSFP
jgi:predicted enzyme related to lactoylglutathione lyase